MTHELLARTKQLYDAHGQAYDRQTRAFANEIAYPKLVECLKWRMGALKGVRILDVGCGSGELVRMLTTFGANAHGIELSGTQAAAARNGGAAVIEGSMTALPYLEDWFEVVVSFHALNYLPPELVSTALAEASRVLVPRGLLCHACLPSEAKEPVRLPFFGDEVTLYPYSKETLARLFAESGFCDITFQEMFAPHVLLNEVATDTDEVGRMLIQRFYAEPYALLVSAIRR